MGSLGTALGSEAFVEVRFDGEVAAKSRAIGTAKESGTTQAGDPGTASGSRKGGTISSALADGLDGGSIDDVAGHGCGVAGGCWGICSGGTVGRPAFDFGGGSPIARAGVATGNLIRAGPGGQAA